LIVTTIEWDPTNSCFILQIEGSTDAPDACQILLWAGYGGPLGNYTRLCGSAGGCDANAGVPTVGVS
jgi:hypothetical protein